MPTDVSVVIPTFRRPEKLAQAIASVLEQPATALEVIVVDDSPEGSADPVVRNAADARVRYIKNPNPSGGRPGAVRNLGWPQASGTYVHFLDDDDIVPEGHYAAAKSAFAARPDAGVVFGAIQPFGEDAALVEQERAFFANAARRARQCERIGPKLAFAAHMFFHSTLLVCGAAMVRRECIAGIQGFDAELPLMEDVDFYARAIRHFGACFTDPVALHYRIGPSLMRSPNIQPVINQCYLRMHTKYRAEWGAIDFYALKTLARTVLRAA
jgi:glycosyltransferase involved in cell wall biosynthesis